MSWISASTSEPVATTESGLSLVVRRAGGPWGRGRGLFAMPGLLDPDDGPPVALWLGRTPQVHTFGMSQPIAVVGADATRQGSRRRRPTALRVRQVEVLEPGQLGHWSWPPPFTLELAPTDADLLGLGAGASLNLEWRRPSKAIAP